jgi:hypothetical protein
MFTVLQDLQLCDEYLNSTPPMSPVDKYMDASPSMSPINDVEHDDIYQRKLNAASFLANGILCQFASRNVLPPAPLVS